MVANNAGQPATPADLINVDEVIGKYYDLVPDPEVPEQRVIFGTSGHRGSSLKTSFNEAHIIAISQAIAEYRKKAGVTGPLYLGSDTPALSGPAIFPHADPFCRQVPGKPIFFIKGFPAGPFSAFRHETC